MSEEFKTPVAFDVPDVVRQRAAASTTRGGGLKRRVLLVDDSEDSCELYQALLERAGHVVATALDGHRALEALGRERFDVAIIDIGLPDIDGYEVVRRARAKLGSAAPVMVAVTGYAGGADREEAARAGFDVYLTKPVDTNLLVAAVSAGTQRSV